MRIPDQLSVCCDAPTYLDLLAYEFSTDTISVCCVKCREQIAGAGLSDVDPEVRAGMLTARWRQSVYWVAIQERLRMAAKAFKPNFFINPS